MAFANFPARFGAATELAEDLPRLELRVRPLAGAAQLRACAVGLFLGFWLALPLVEALRPGAALVPPLSARVTRPAFPSSLSTPTHSAFLSWTGPGSAPETH